MAEQTKERSFLGISIGETCAVPAMLAPSDTILGGLTLVDPADGLLDAEACLG